LFQNRSTPDILRALITRFWSPDVNSALEFLIPDFEVFENAFDDPEGEEKMKPDKYYLFDRSAGIITMGHE
jgi:hypothetical protein